MTSYVFERLRSVFTVALGSLSLGALLLGPVVSHAQVERQAQPSAYTGLMLGYGDSTNLDGRFAIGADVGLVMPSGYRGGIFFIGNSAGEDESVSHFGLEGGMAFPSLAEGLNAGVRAGLETTTGPVATTNFAAGAFASYDYMVREDISVGVEPSVMLSFGDNSHTTFYALATGKFWF